MNDLLLSVGLLFLWSANNIVKGTGPGIEGALGKCGLDQVSLNGCSQVTLIFCHSRCFCYPSPLFCSASDEGFCPYSSHRRGNGQYLLLRQGLSDLAKYGTTSILIRRVIYTWVWDVSRLPLIEESLILRTRGVSACFGIKITSIYLRLKKWWFIASQQDKPC